jgi:hypothetical protein
MADIVVGSTPLRAKIKGFAASPKQGMNFDIRYLPVAASGTLSFGTFVTIASGVLSEATNTSTAIHGITFNTNSTSWDSNNVIGKRINERRAVNASGATSGVGVLSSTPMVEYAVADSALEFVINITAGTALATTHVGITCDIETDATPQFYAAVATSVEGVLTITRLVDPIGTVGGRVMAVITPSKRQAA